MKAIRFHRHGGPEVLQYPHMGRKAELLEAAELFFAGVIRPAVDTAFPLAEAARAQERPEAREQFGKIVLLAGQEPSG